MSTQITPERVRRSLQSRYNPIASLTPAYLTSSLDMFAMGYLGQFARLADAMERRDDKIAACRRKRISAIARYGFEILTIDTVEDEALATTAEEHKKVLEYFYNHVTAINAVDENQRGGFPMLVRQMADSIGKRYAVHEIVLKPGTGSEDGGLTGELRFCPLWFFENRAGRLRFLDTDMASEGKPMDEDKWLVTVGDGIMEACAVCYLYKRLPLQDWLTFTEKYGMPGILGKTTAPNGTSEWQAMETAVSSFMNDWAAVVNIGAEIELVDARGGSMNPFEPLIERMDRAISILWRGADLSTMSAGNGQGQGASVQENESELLEQDDAAWLAETLQMQIDRLVIEYHFGKGVQPLAYITIKTRDDGDTRLDIEVLKAAKELGIPVAIKDARERLGLVTPDEGEDLLAGPEKPEVDPAKAAKAKEDALANENRSPSADSPVMGKLMAKARDFFPASVAKDMAPLRAALASVLNGADDGMMERAAALAKRMHDPDFTRALIQSAHSSDALFKILSAAAANGLATTPAMANEYDESQPRDPAGTETGGQWTASGSKHKTLYRAAKDEYVTDTASFAETLETAKVYQNNPGYGGANLYRAEVDIDPKKVLDLVEAPDPIAAIMKKTGKSHPGAIGADEWVPRVSYDLREKGIEWVRVKESYPANTITWIWVGGDDPEMEQIIQT